MNVTSHDLLRLLPLLLPAIASLIVLLFAAVNPDDRTWGPLVAVAAAGASIAAIVWGPAAGGEPLLGGMLVMDRYTVFFLLLVMAMLAGAVSVATAGWRASDYAHGEFWALMLFATCGMGLLAASTNLLLIFIGVELMSISVYALVGSDRGRPRPPEAALKYFLLGAFSSAFLLFGIAFVYGATGSFELRDVFRTTSSAMYGAPRAEMLLGISLMLVGFGFKTSTAPFHMWTPDAYTGAPSPVTAFMASAVKAASFAAFIRVFAMSLGPARGYWSDLIAVAAALTIVVGNFGAISQTELKRLLAYSGIAHAGYMLIGLRAASIDPELATPSILFYLFAYTFTTLGLFAIVSAIERWQGKEIRLADLAGLSRRHPLMAAAMTIFLLALAGVPPTSGFTAKLYVFSAAVKIGDYLLAVIGVLASAVSLYYYLRVVVFMYMREPEPGAETNTATAEPFARLPTIYAVVACAVLVVLVAGALPEGFLRFARAASASASAGVTHVSGI